jgi:nucleoside-diphosphate-sugar epimerase
LIDVHINDLATAYILLVEEALKPNGGAATWGPEAYYFTETADHTWLDVTAAIAKIAHGRGAILTADIDQLDVAEASKVHPWAPLLWGGNCRSRADRLRSLGWKPAGPTIYESLPAMVDFEINSLGTQSDKTTFDPKK